MLHEFAVEPSLLNNWARFRYVTEKFDFHQGRLISRYPRKWVRMVYESLEGVSEIDRKKIEIKLQGIDAKMISRKNDWDVDLNWLQNAEQEHGKQAFHAILSAENPRNHCHVLREQDLDESVPLWNIPDQRTIQRNATEMANTLEPIFRIAKKLVFVDPYFDSAKKTAVNALKAYLHHCKTLPDYPEIIFFTKDNGNCNFQQECEQKLANLIPIGKKITLAYCAAQSGSDGLHNRYVLTDRGGVSLGWGLDEGSAGQTDDVGLLAQAVYAQRWDQYCGAIPTFTKQKEFIIAGSAT
jgi:hypothetical protein